MKTLMTALMVWASAQTGLPVPDTHPTVVMADSCEIEREYRGDPNWACTGDGMRITAIYNQETRTMTLPDTWSPDSLYDVSILLHELVHHMQAEQGLTNGKVECPGRDIERPAYEAQLAFIEATGLPGFQTLGINGLAYNMLTNCSMYGR